MNYNMRNGLLDNSYPSGESYYKFLAYLLAGYIVLLMFFGRFESLQKITIWAVGPIFSVIVISNFIKYPIKIPKEVYLFGLFWLWTFPGYLSVVYVEGYFRYFRLIFTILVLFFCIQIVLIKTGNVKLIYKALILNCSLFLFYAIYAGDFFTVSEGEENLRLHALVNNSNGFAYIGITGIAGILFIWNEIKKMNSRIWYIVLLSSFVVMIILTASRSGFITMIALFVFWLIFCYYESFKKHALLYIMAMIISIPLIYMGYSYLMEETYLGERLDVTVAEEGGLTTESRFILYEEGFEMFKKNPVYGVGLSQFIYFSSKSSIAHSEYMELLATTGLGGFLIMFFFYYVILKKIRAIKKVVKDKDILYRLNLSYAVIFSILLFGFFRANFLDILTMIQIAVVAGYTNYLAYKYKAYMEVVKFKEKVSSIETQSESLSSS